ncbi:VOC family protein [uncultured Amnibacterium sp.]|uniref:VOC family protein n=1 Tax=uncultured Amnibacterium sp. TaxID=1631851 RepID=UPI0035C9B1DE
MTDLLADATDLGAVTLRVADLDSMTTYYADGVGLQVLATGRDSIVLGRGDRAAVELRHAPELQHAPTSAAGLFHTAIVFGSQGALARAAYSVATRHPASFTGSSDHLVSKALYFDDPEGNGVELYWDRPRAEWPEPEPGSLVRMATLPLDPNRFLREHLDQDAQADAFVGHVHLKVGDIPSARAFYVDVVGFEVTVAFGDQALFVSAGGYHHHVGMNTWASNGAGPRTPALGLGQVTIRVPDADALAGLRDRLRISGVPVEDDGDTLTFADPWRNIVRASITPR